MNQLQTPAKVLIVDDHPMVREALAMRISSQPDLVVCGEAATEDEALGLLGRTNPDLIVIDISLKSGDGLELIKQVKSRQSPAKMLVVSGFQASLYAERALRAGAMGYLNKQESNDQVIQAIRTVLNGGHHLSSEISQRLIAQALGGSEAAKTPIEQFTDRELEVFRLIGQGLTTRGIANRLHLSAHTIDTHRENIKRKLGAKNAAELSCHAVRWVLENS